jgi:hypothetical protein
LRFQISSFRSDNPPFTRGNVQFFETPEGAEPWIDGPTQDWLARLSGAQPAPSATGATRQGGAVAVGSKNLSVLIVRVSYTDVSVSCQFCSCGTCGWRSILRATRYNAELPCALSVYRRSLRQAGCASIHSRVSLPAGASRRQAARFHSQPLAFSHCSTSRRPLAAAPSHVYMLQLQPFARAHCSTARCPPLAAALHDSCSDPTRSRSPTATAALQRARPPPPHCTWSAARGPHAGHIRSRAPTEAPQCARPPPPGGMFARSTLSHWSVPTAVL